MPLLVSKSPISFTTYDALFVKLAQIFPEEDMSAFKLFLQRHIQKYVAESVSMSFSPGFGFDAISAEGFLSFIFDHATIHFSLNKRKGCHLLYGKSHVAIRQGLINHLPLWFRCWALKRKLIHFQLDVFVASYFGQSVDILDIVDIGMGHSIYLLTCQKKCGGVSKVVLKKEELPNQTFFCSLLSLLGRPSFKTRHIEIKGEGWELSEYLGSQTLDVVENVQDVQLIKPQLVFHAVLGDFLGRGDRHFENYIVRGGSLFPVDISFLFWPDNERWVEKYVSGGLYELNGFSHFYTPEKISQFYEMYRSDAMALKLRYQDIVNLVKTFFGKQSKVDRYSRFEIGRAHV